MSSTNRKCHRTRQTHYLDVDRFTQCKTQKLSRQRVPVIAQNVQIERFNKPFFLAYALDKHFGANNLGRI